MTLSISIRKEEERDFKLIFKLVEKAFNSQVQARLVSRLREEASPYLSLVAEVENTPVGHIFYSPVVIENNSRKISVAQLSPISVVPKYQGKGIGSHLIESSFQHCVEVGWSAVFLVGNPVYYSRFGFEMAKARDFTHDGAHAEYLQCRELALGSFASLSGNVKFHTAFEELTGE